MEKENNNRTKWLHLRLTEAEYNKIHSAFAKTTTRRLSDYARKILLGKPMIGSYRNRSMDDFMAELIRLRTELNGIGNNFNQVVKKLHTSPRSEAIQSLLLAWELEKRSMLRQIEGIKEYIEKQGQSW